MSEFAKMLNLIKEYSINKIKTFNVQIAEVKTLDPFQIQVGDLVLGKGDLYIAESLVKSLSLGDINKSDLMAIVPLENMQRFIVLSKVVELWVNYILNI